MFAKSQKDGSQLSDASYRGNLSGGLHDRDVLDTAKNVNGYVHFRKDALFEFIRGLKVGCPQKSNVLYMLYCLQLIASLTKLGRIIMIDDH